MNFIKKDLIIKILLKFYILTIKYLYPFFKCVIYPFLWKCFSISVSKRYLYTFKYCQSSLWNTFWESNLLSICATKFGQDYDVEWRYCSPLIFVVLTDSKYNSLSPHNHDFASTFLLFDIVRALLLYLFWIRWFERKLLTDLT